MYSTAEHSVMTANTVSLCVSTISSNKWVHTSLTVLNTNMSDNDVRLQHKRWIQWVINFKFTNNKLPVKNLESAGDVSIFAANLSAITDMPPATPRTDCTQRTIYLFIYLFNVLRHYIIIIIIISFFSVCFVCCPWFVYFLCSCVVSVIGFWSCCTSPLTLRRLMSYIYI